MSITQATAANRQRRGPATVYVSLYAPAGRRRYWWYSYRCPECATYQFGRSRDLTGVTGARRAGCGHTVNVVIARTYPAGGVRA